MLYGFILLEQEILAKQLGIIKLMQANIRIIAFMSPQLEYAKNYIKKAYHNDKFFYGIISVCPILNTSEDKLLIILIEFILTPNLLAIDHKLSPF